MTITLQSGESTVTLCDGADRAVGKALGPAGLDIDVAPGLRRRAYLEAPGVSYEAAGNDEVVVGFRVRLLCASADAAAAAAAAAAANTPRVGTLTVGDLVVAGAGLRRLRPVVAGVAVLIEYQFGGTATVAVAPEA